MADRRNTLIKLFHKWKGEKYIPSAMHSAIRWSKTDPFLEYQDCVDWQREDTDSKVDNSKTKNNAVTIPVLVATPPASNSNYMHITTLPKRKKLNAVPQYHKMKKVKFSHNIDPSAPTKNSHWHSVAEQ